VVAIAQENHAANSVTNNKTLRTLYDAMCNFRIAAVHRERLALRVPRPECTVLRPRQQPPMG